MCLREELFGRPSDVEKGGKNKRGKVAGALGLGVGGTSCTRRSQLPAWGGG